MRESAVKARSLDPASCRAPRHRWALGMVFVLLATCRVARLAAQTPQTPREILDQLQNLTIDPGQIYVLRDAHISRAGMKLYFNRGFIGFLSPAAGEVTGAVFAGDGEVLLIPPEQAEKRSLAQFIQSPILEDRFTAAYLRFTDQTARELLAWARRPEPDDPDQPTGFAAQWNPLVRTLNPGSSPRVLEDLLGDRSQPCFLARLEGVDLGAFEIVDDERLEESVRVGAMRRENDLLYANLWCAFSSHPPRAPSAARLGPARVGSYKIDTRILADNSLEGTAELEIESLSAADRVLPFVLSRYLKVSGVTDASGRDLLVVQGLPEEASQAEAREDDGLEVVLPSPHPVGEKFRLVFNYRGNVIGDVGNGVLYVGARGSWYPRVPASGRATFDLTFLYPERLSFVATGTRAEEETADGWTKSRWRSDGLFQVAGFNLGPYQAVTRRAGDVRVEVYAAPEAEASLESRHVAAAARADVAEALPLGRQPVAIAPAPVRPLQPSALLERVADSAAGAVNYFAGLFGPFPYPRVAISQIPGRFGQGWPELVYLPTLSFLREEERKQMGLEGKSGGLLDQTLLPHEISHQWWGNLLGWKTYHDLWLSEGFASYAAALYLSSQKDSSRKLLEVLRAYKGDLLAKTKTGSTVESSGPIAMGWRLSNSLNPLGYDQIVYKKAAWVLHMLRGLMTDPTSGSDERFFRMLHDFVALHGGENVSTEDFVHHAEKYMTRASDLDRNGRLDWFFNEWVYGVGIPAYQVTFQTRPLTARKYLVEGSIEQSGVPDDFEMLVPVVAFYPKDKRAILGRVAVGENGGQFRFTTSARPTHVSLDEDNLLAVVR